MSIITQLDGRKSALSGTCGKLDINNRLREWKTVPDMPRERRQSRLLVHGKYVYAIDAVCNDEVASHWGAIDRIDTTTDIWESDIARLPDPMKQYEIFYKQLVFLYAYVYLRT